MFELELFVADCTAVLKENGSHRLVREVVSRAVSDPAGALKCLGTPQRAEIQTLYRSKDLTILNVIWGPRMTLMPHNHQMWAVIGIYTGRGQHLLAPPARRPGWAGGSRWCTIALRKRCRTAGTTYHPFGYQSDPPFDRCPPRVRRRLFCGAAWRMGSRKPPGEAM